jgi:predicted DNA-binding protein (MmcQ/YjbR family)
MDVESLRNYCLSKPFTEEAFPFDEHTLVFKVMGKIFALIGLNAENHAVNLKCDPERALELREYHPEDIIPGYHMNKAHWNTVTLDGVLTDQLIRELIDHSYGLIVEKVPKSVKAIYESSN